jgi:hypothetical protein
MIEERVRGEEEEKEKEVSGLDKARLSQLPQRIPHRHLYECIKGSLEYPTWSSAQMDYRSDILIVRAYS